MHEKDSKSSRLMLGRFVASWIDFIFPCKGEGPKWTDCHVSETPPQSRRHVKRSEKSVEIPQFEKAARFTPVEAS